jgi:hypothetical protein
MPEYTLAQAIALTGRSRSTLIRAIRSGKLSAIRDAAGSYQVEPSELYRVFPAGNGGLPPDRGNGVPRHAGIAALTRAIDQSPEHFYALLDQAKDYAGRLEAEQAKVAMLQETVSDLRRRLDAEAEERRRLTAILADQRTAPAAIRRWWPWSK